MTSSYGKYCGTLVLPIAFVVLWGAGLMYNRDANSTQWPLPTDVVTHSIVPVSSDLWKLFARDKTEFYELVYEGPSKDQTQERKEGDVTVASRRGVTDIQTLQYNAGCFPNLLLDNDGAAYTYPYQFRQLDSGDDLNTNQKPSGVQTFPSMTICQCLEDVNEILTKYRAAATGDDPDAAQKTWLTNYIKADGTNSIKVGTDIGDIEKPNDGAEGPSHSDTFKQALDAIASDLQSKNSIKFKKGAIESCVTNYIGQHTTQYDGVIGTRQLIDIGQILIVIGILTVFASSLYYMSPKEETLKTADELIQSNEKEMNLRDANSTWLITFLHFANCCFAIVAFVWVVEYDHFDKCDNRKGDCKENNSLLNGRYGTFDNVNSPVNATFTAVAITTLIVVLIGSIGRLAAVWAQGWVAKVSENKVVRRVLTDLPFISGFAVIGTALLAQSGVQDTSSLLFAFALVFSAGLLQHISNVSKLLYDTLCRSTDAAVMKKLFEGEDVNQAKHVFQFFGWSRMMIFITMLLSSIAYLSMTREIVQTSAVQSFTNGQLFYYILAFFWSNIGYDMLRELVPFTFEKMHMDASKIFTCMIYLAYFNWNMWMIDNADNHVADHRSHALHNGVVF